MKKIFYVLTGLLIVIYLSTLFFDDYNIVVQYVRHMSLLIIIAIIIYGLTSLFATQIIRRNNLDGYKELFVQSTRIFIFAAILVGVAYVQFQYINYSIGLNLDYCRYYDAYDNLLYETKFKGACPTLDISENTEESLKFTVSENTEYSQAGNTLIDGKDYRDSNLNQMRSVSVEILYQNHGIVYAYSEEENTILLESEDGNVGVYSKQIDVLDYRESDSQGYVFKTAKKSTNIFGTESEIRDFDYNELVIEDVDFETTKYFITNDDADYYVLSKEITQEGVLEQTEVFRISLPDPEAPINRQFQIDSILTVDQNDLGLVHQFVTIEEHTDTKKIIIVNEYEDQYYHTEQTYKIRDNFESFYDSYTYHTDLEDIDYEIWKYMETFERNGVTIYYDDVTTNGLGYDFVIKTFKTFEPTEFGKKTTVYYENEYQYADSFTGYLFHPESGIHNRINTLYKTLISAQKDSFSTVGFVSTVSRNDFYVIPVYLEDIGF